MKYDRDNYEIDTICPLWVDQQVVRLIEHNTTILEIGCATGYIGRHLKQKMGCKIYGIELDKQSAEKAIQYYEKIFIADVENEDILKGLQTKYDYILCMNVVEHLKKPEIAIIKLKELLKDNGYMILTIPNIAHFSIRLKLLFGNFKYEEYGILDCDHIKFFTLKSIKELIKESGLLIEHFSIDPDNGIPKFHGLLLRLPGGVAFLRMFYSFFPRFFGYQFIFKLRKA